MAPAGESCSPRVPVIDEHRRQPGVRVPGGRDPADIPAIARGEKRQQADRRMFRGVERTRRLPRSDARGRQGLVGDRPPDTLGMEDLLGKSSGCRATTSPPCSRRRKETTWERTTTRPAETVTAAADPAPSALPRRGRRGGSGCIGCHVGHGHVGHGPVGHGRAGSRRGGSGCIGWHAR